MLMLAGIGINSRASTGLTGVTYTGLTGALALTFPELERVALFKPLIVSAVGTESG